MDTIATTQSLLMCNGSARPVMVALTQNERRLIAAAPDLLAALKRIADMKNHAVFSVLDAKQRITQLENIARAAIAKAKGRS